MVGAPTMAGGATLGRVHGGPNQRQLGEATMAGGATVASSTSRRALFLLQRNFLEGS